MRDRHVVWPCSLSVAASRFFFAAQLDVLDRVMDQIQDDREWSAEEPPYWLKPRIWLTKTLELVIAVVLFLWLPAAIVVSRVYKWVRSLLPWKRRRILKDNVVVITGASSGIGEVRNSVLQFHQTAQVQFWNNSDRVVRKPV